MVSHEVVKYLPLVAPSSAPVHASLPPVTAAASPASKPPHMGMVVLADTSVASDNVGDQIIVAAARRELAQLLGDRVTFTVSTHSPLGHRGHRLLREAEAAFVLGTNLLPATPSIRQLWRVPPLPARERKFVLCGVGFGGQPSVASARFLRTVLHPDALHSTRDERTASFLRDVGLQAINTGCPTTWSSPRGCGEPARWNRQSAAAVLVLNASLGQADVERRIAHATLDAFEEVTVWPQAGRDVEYVRRLVGGRARVLPGSLAAYEAALGAEVDVVTTRLHAALRAMGLGRRTTLFALDDRVARTAKDARCTVFPAPADQASAGAAITSPDHAPFTPHDEAIGTWHESTIRLLG
jgi:hypothetical protein